MCIRATLCLVVSSLGFAIIGCGDGGPKLAGVTGTVMLGSKPIAGATVTMQIEGVKAQASMGFTDSLGKFTMKTGGRPGVPVGKARVGISKAGDTTGGMATPDMKPEDMMQMQQAAGAATEQKAPPKPEIPLKYADPTMSGLTETIDANESKNIFVFTLAE